jgi:hypothetical protein
METTQENYELLVKFPDQSPSFVHGYEAGQISEKLRDLRAMAVATVVHTANREVLASIAEMRGWSVDFEDTEYEEWSKAEFVLKIDGKPKLTVVK